MNSYNFHRYLKIELWVMLQLWVYKYSVAPKLLGQKRSLTIKWCWLARNRDFVNMLKSSDFLLVFGCCVSSKHKWGKVKKQLEWDCLVLDFTVLETNIYEFSHEKLLLNWSFVAVSLVWCQTSSISISSHSVVTKSWNPPVTFSVSWHWCIWY